MDANVNDVQQIATQLLAGMLANRHIYANVSDEGGKGQQEQKLIVVAIEMAESLVEHLQRRQGDRTQDE